MNIKGGFKKRYLIFLGILLLLVVYFGPLMGGYSFTEESAIRHSFPNQDGETVFEKEFGSKKVVIWDTGTQSYVKLISKTWGTFYRATSLDAISAVTSEEKMKISWSASQNENNYYHTLLAAEVLDDDIVKVVVSDESGNEDDTTLNEAKEQSTVYVEMDVINGYAAHYSYLPNSNVGGFVFRGLNSDGEVVSVE